MTTVRQIEANRRNALLSTGPKTEAGKGKSSRNAYRHGLTARDVPVVGPGEDEAEYDAMRLGMRIALDPGDAHEDELVDRIINCAWKRRRFEAYEAATLTTVDFDPRAGFFGGNASLLDLIHRYHQRTERDYHRCLAALHRCQKLREARDRQRAIVLAQQAAGGATGSGAKSKREESQALELMVLTLLHQWREARQARLSEEESAGCETKPMCPQTPLPSELAGNEVEEAADHESKTDVAM
ncbi:MAG: hypothetical protein AB7S36_12305 [Planctomycetota bacterium]